MQNSQTDTSRIDTKIVAQDSITVDTGTALTDRQVVTTAPLKTRVRRLFLWEKLFASISMGLGIMMMGVGTVEYPDRSISLRQATVIESIDRQPLPTITTASNLPANRDRNPVDSSTKPDRLQAALATLQEAKTALTLSQADVAQAEINIQTFKKDYDRYQDLYKRGSANSQQLAQARSGYDFAQKQKSYALHGLKQVEQQLAAAKADLNIVRSQSRSSKICSRISASKLRAQIPSRANKDS
ncbi:hypothetical protein [Chamaesiphon polymorphus]|uniref:Uncharacterized protein n=1 Tax=Chamaesiphon polymorphus CCALA 037 TaxID=2107692 RepID=A0A2T1GIH1_9CYAN|nr:hypothetical protein [Chamaesiphon polymorphus]PSB57544.1 hypothetical protein C7B77_08070 [Chamaesiphon polymorphus CCALA 037]